MRPPNAIEPYRWRAEYRDGGRLRQLDADGLHYTSEIDLSRIARLVIEGHPSGELILAADATRPIDEVIVRARMSIALPSWHSQGQRILLGFRYGTREDVLEITPAGRVQPYDGPPITDMAIAAAERQ